MIRGKRSCCIVAFGALCLGSLMVDGAPRLRRHRQKTKRDVSGRRCASSRSYLTAALSTMDGAAMTMFSYADNRLTGPRGSAVRAPSPAADNNWVTVTWMPHSSLSQTSHVTLRISSIHAIIEDSSVQSGSSAPDEWRVEVSVHGMGGLSLVPVVSSSTAAPIVSRKEDAAVTRRRLYPSVLNATHDCILDQVLQAPIRWRDLPRDACIAIKVLERGDKVVFETTVALFDSYGRVKTGLQRLDLTKPDSAGTTTDSPTNPGLIKPPQRNGPGKWEEDDLVWKASRILEQLDTFEVARKGGVRPDGTSTAGGNETEAFGDIPSVPWLDALTRQHSTSILNEAVKEQRPHPILSLSENERTSATIIIELPKFEVPVIHEETHYPLPTESASGPVSALDLAQYRKNSREKAVSSVPNSDYMELVPFLDYESELDNPVEDKYRTLAHDLLRGLVDPALKPDREQRDRLAAIIASPSHHPTREEKGETIVLVLVFCVTTLLTTLLPCCCSTKTCYGVSGSV